MTLNQELSTELSSNHLTKASPSSQSTSIASRGAFEFKVNPLSSKQIQGIARRLQKKKKEKSSIISRFDVIEELPVVGEIPITDDVAEIERILSPLVQNGRQIHSEIISKVSTSEDWLLLADEEKYAILNMTDDQLGELSLIYSTVNIAEWQTDPLTQAKLDANTIRSCLSGALGLTDLYYLLVESPTSLLSAKGAVQILKRVGLRYLGWFGLGLAVWDFIDCVS